MLVDWNPNTSVALGVGVSDPCVVGGAEVSSGWDGVKLTATTVVGVRTSMIVDKTNCDSSTATVDVLMLLETPAEGRMLVDWNPNTSVALGVGVSDPCVVGGAEVSSGWNGVKLTATTVVGVRTSMIVDKTNCDSSTATVDVLMLLETPTLKLLVGLSSIMIEELSMDPLCVGEGVTVGITELVNCSRDVRDVVGVGSSNTGLVDDACRVGVTSKLGPSVGEVDVKAAKNELVGWSKNKEDRSWEFVGDVVDELCANNIAEDDKN